MACASAKWRGEQGLGENGRVTSSTGDRPASAPSSGEEDPRRVDHLNADLPPEVYAAPERARPAPGSREEMLYLRRTSTWVNMVIALAACALVVVLIVAIVPRTTTEFERDIDVAEVASQVEGSAEFDLAQPNMGEGWSANEASYSDSGDPAVPTWYISMIGPNDQWVTFRQARTDSEAWVQSHLDDAQEDSAVTLGGREWEAYQSVGGTPMRFLVTEVDGVTYMVAGQAAGGTLETAAERQLEAAGA